MTKENEYSAVQPAVEFYKIMLALPVNVDILSEKLEFIPSFVLNTNRPIKSVWMDGWLLVSALINVRL